jgi:hypothetical protein
MTSLVDRYVYTALRRVPEGQRADIDRELRASIEDAVDARVEAGKSREAAVESTLLELGDPDRLADQYANRPNYLIGPELFPAWRRLMMMLFTVVLPILVGVNVVTQLIDDPEIGKVIGGAVTTILTAGVHLAFWATLVFVILEYTDTGKAELRTTWTLKDLPTYERSRQGLTELAVALVWPVLLIAALVLQQFTLTDVPVLDPAHWSFWWPYLIAVFVLEGVYAIWVYRLGTFTRTVATANAVVSLLSAVPLVWLLATDRFFNPAFTSFVEVGSGDSKQWVTAIAITAVVLASLWDIVDVTLRAERTRRGLPTKTAGSGNTYTFG